jgi:hypothetical protein
LVAIVEMQRDDVPRGIVMRESDYVGAAIRETIENYTLSFFRHSLSQYRKYVDHATTKLDLSGVKELRFTKLSRNPNAIFRLDVRRLRNATCKTTGLVVGG